MATRKQASKVGGTAQTRATVTPRPKPKVSKPSASRRAAADVAELSARLLQAVPEPRCELAFRSPFELLIATILSAQSTDKMVNAVTPLLFERYPTPAALAAASQEDVELLVKRTGFFRNKAKSIRGAAQKLVDEFEGEVPRTIEQLVSLPGVARKTANVVLGTAYRINAGFVVDTHIARVSQRLGLAEGSEPVKIEQELCATFAQEQWSDTGHRLLLHGRYTCLAKAPCCALCPLNELCASRLGPPEHGSWQERATLEAQRVSQRSEQ